MIVDNVQGKIKNLSLILAFFTLIGFTVSTATAQSIVLDLDAQPVRFTNNTSSHPTNPYRVLVNNGGRSGRNAGSVWDYYNTITQYDAVNDRNVTVRVRLTIQDVVDAEIRTLDLDGTTPGQSGTDNSRLHRFEPYIDVDRNNGYVLFKIQFFDQETGEDVYAYNYYTTAIDIDGSNNAQEFVEFGGFSSYTVDASTGLTITTNNLTGRTRFRGITNSINPMEFENTAAVIANYTNPNNEITFVIGAAGGSLDERQHSISVGASENTFTTPETTDNPLPNAIDDNGITINTILGGVSIPNVLANDFYNSLPVVPSEFTLSIVNAASHPGITLVTSGANKGQVAVAPGTPVGDYSLLYEICTVAAPTNRCDIANVLVPVRIAQLEVKKTAPAQVNAGSEIPYTITIKNTGVVEAIDVTFSDVLPANTSYVANTASVSHDGNNLPIDASTYPFGSGNSFVVDELESGGEIEISFSILVPSNYDQTTVVNQGSSEFDGSSQPVLSDDPNVPGVSDPTVTNVIFEPTWTLTKTAQQTSFTAADQTLNFTFVLTNTGNVSISNIVLNDQFVDANPGVVRGSDQTGNNDNILEPGEVWTYTAQYTTQQADVNNGSFTNTATATGSPASGTLSDASDTETVNAAAAPAITVVKTGAFSDTNTDGIAQPGELVNYSFTVTNTGNVTLTGVKVNDPMLSGGADIAVTPSTLAPGQTGTAAASYAVSQADIDEGFVRNLATATGTPPSGPPVTGTSTAPEPLTPGDPGYDPECTDCTVTPLPQAPGWTLTKTAAEASYGSVGDKINFTITVANTGNVTITAVSVSDPTADVDPGVVRGADQVGNGDSVLEPGEVWAYTAVRTVSQGDLNTGSYSNTATATGTPAGGTLDPASDTETVNAAAAPAITVVKTGAFADTNTDGIAQPGELVNYSFTVTNTGNVTLTGVKVNDPMLGAADIAVTPSTLAPSQTGTATASYTVGQADIDEGFVRNLATATGTPPSGPPVTGTSTAPEPLTPGDPGYDPECADCTVTPLPQAPGWTLTKTAAEDSYGSVGDKINFTITVANMGNVTITAVSVSDPTADADPGVVRGADQVGNGDDVLEPGEVWAYTAVRTVSQGDLNTGSYSNTATATGTPAGGTLEPASDTETVNAAAAPAITVVKTGAFSDTNTDGIAQPGELVNYSFTVSNTGNVTLTGVKVNDPLLGAADITVTPSTLAPGQTGTATASYAISQLDIDEGFVRNLATATGTPPSGPPVTGTSTAPEPLTPGDPGYDPECTDCTVTPLPQSPSITISKVSDISSYDRTDVLITYTIKVKNNGNVSLSSIDVQDVGADAGPNYVSGDANDDDVLSPNEEWTYTATYTTKPADLDSGRYDNTAIVTALDPSGGQVDDEDTESVQSGLVPIVANDDDMTSIPVDLFVGNSNLVNVLVNDVLGEDAPSITQVIMTIVTPATPVGGGLVPVLDTSTGIVAVPAGTPEGSYSIRYQICESSNPTNCDDALVTVLVTCDDTGGISGQVYQMDGDTRIPISNANLTLLQNGVVVAAQVTGGNGNYAFFGVQPGSYLLQVQDVNLNNMGLYPVESSLYFTDIGACLPQVHDFEYEMSPLPVLGDLVWYDLNGNGIQDEWYDANNDGQITKTIPDANGYYDYAMWEWLDLNGDGSWEGPQNEGELNMAGFGQDNSPNVIVRGPDGYYREVIVGIQGRWRVRPVSNNQPLYGEFTAELVKDSYFREAAIEMMDSGLIKNIPGFAAKISDDGSLIPNKLASEVECIVSTDNPATTQLVQLDGVNKGLDFGVNCFMVLNIVANDDDASNNPIDSMTGGIAISNILANDTLDGQTATIGTVVISVTDNGGQNFVVIDPATGSVTVASGTPAGTYVQSYEICEIQYLSNCDSAVVTVVVEETPTTISGLKFHDLNANGALDEDEPGLGGWTIYVDLNDNGTLDQGEPSTVSANDGTWSIPGLLGGNYIIREVIHDQNWVQSLPGESNDFTIDVEIVQGGDFSALLFGNYTTGSISGVKFFDSNRNGLRDDNETLLEGWTIYIDSNGNGQLDDGEPFAVTDSNGAYSFDNLEPGSYVLREVLAGMDGWIQTLPGEENSFRHVVDVSSQGASENVDFGNFMISGITGTKWHDINGNGVRDLGEALLAGWTIYIDLNNNGMFDNGEPSQVTDTNGAYTFDGLDLGTYTIREVMQDGWLQTFPGPAAGESHRVELNGETNSIVYNFGNALASTIAGYKWHDSNVNGSRDDDESMLSGWVFYIDSNMNGEYDFAEVSVTSDENGQFEFANLLPGQYVIREVGKDGWQQVYPVNNVGHSLSIISGSSVEIVFGNATDDEVIDSLQPKISTIEGNMWYDYVEDGSWNHKLDLDYSKDRIDEIEIAEWKISLTGIDYNGDKVEMSTFTKPDGSYTFVDVPDGEYRIDREYRDTWVPSFPIVVDENPEGQFHIVRVSRGYGGLASSDRTIVAGNVRNWMDDLQEGENMLYAGAYLHLDTDDDGLVDTKFFVSGPLSMKWDRPVMRETDYEFTGFEFIGHSERFGRIELTPLSGYKVLGSLNGQPGDSLVASQFDMPFRLSVDGEFWNMPYSGFPEMSGQVSQMLPYNQKHVMLSSQQVPLYDTFGRKLATMMGFEFMPLYGADFSTNRSVFGTAPAEHYPVLMESDGARHVLHHTMEQHRLLLGNGIDASALFVRNQRHDRTVPKSEALQNDGVAFLTSVIANQQSAVSVTANATGYLYAWIDYNRDGIWTDDERIIENEPIQSGQNILDFNVPLGVASGESYARFRLCDCPNETEPVGVVTGGEVEDYLVIINATGAVVQGSVWLDANENGIRDINESGIAGIRVFADLNKNGRHDQGEPLANTNSSGSYTLGGLPSGSVQIQPDYGDRWAVTNISGDGFATVELTQGQSVSGLNFGLRNLGTTSIDDDSTVPREFGLDQNYPNPFNPTTTIQYRLAEASSVQLSVFDMNGRVVASLVNDRQSAGEYSIAFDASALASGVYVYRLVAGGHVFTQKLTLIK